MDAYAILNIKLEKKTSQKLRERGKKYLEKCEWENI